MVSTPFLIQIVLICTLIDFERWITHIRMNTLSHAINWFKDSQGCCTGHVQFSDRVCAIRLLVELLAWLLAWLLASWVTGMGLCPWPCCLPSTDWQTVGPGSHPPQVTVLLGYNCSMRLAAETECTCPQQEQIETLNSLLWTLHETDFGQQNRFR